MFKLKWNRPHFWMLCWTKVHSDQEKASSGRNQQQGEVLKARPLGNWHAYFKHPYYSKINYFGGPRKSLPNNYLWTIPTMWNTGVQVYMRKVVTHYNILTRNMLSVFCIKLACCKMQQLLQVNCLPHLFISCQNFEEWEYVEVQGKTFFLRTTNSPTDHFPVPTDLHIQYINQFNKTARPECGNGLNLLLQEATKLASDWHDVKCCVQWIETP